ncbi:hypothetical protein [Microbacterium sp. MMO-10]|uniref:hypothetical protein n=1 Tax=Microbacterium sp. MMO-10 TaxID=3081272 RepID=UPI00301770A0
MTGNSEILAHSFGGWVPTRELTAKERDILVALESQRPHFDLAATEELNERRAAIEGDLVPVCACGWRGAPEPWQPKSSRSSRGGQQHIEHKHHARLNAINGAFAAEIAAAALRHAADAATDPSVAAWLEDRASRVEQVGQYDGEVWPA